jgi:hypothetical protein
MLLLLFCLGCCSANEMPEISGNRIRFPQSSKTLEFQKQIVKLQKEKKLNHSKPVSLVEEPKIIPEWERVVLVRRYRYIEGEELQFDFYDFKGELLSSTDRYFGEFNLHLMLPTERILLAQVTQIYDLNESILFNANGEKIIVIKNRKNTFYSGTSKDGRVFWFISSSTRPVGENEEPVNEYMPFFNPVNTVDLYDSSGNLLDSREFTAESTWIVSVRDIEYQIQVPQPDFPG